MQIFGWYQRRLETSTLQISLNSHLTQESVQEVCYIIGSMYHIILNMRIVLLRNAFCNIWFLLFPNKFQFVFFIVILFYCIICSLGLVLFELDYWKLFFVLLKLVEQVHLFLLKCTRQFMCLLQFELFYVLETILFLIRT